MEGVLGSVGKGWRGYWKRKGYHRLKGSGGQRRKRAELEATRRRWFWKIKVGPKIRIPRIPSPKKLVVRVRDAYMRTMMRLASSGVRGMSMSGDAYGYGGFGRAPIKEYDDKMILHICNSLVMQHAQRPHLDLVSSL